MANQSYKVTVEGEGEYEFVGCTLEHALDLEMNPVGSQEKWMGEDDFEINGDKIYYEINVRAPRRRFSFKIENTKNNKTLKEGNGYSRLTNHGEPEASGLCDSE